MESLPDGIIQDILSHMDNAKDVGSCTCVSRQWKQSLPYIKSLYFPRNLNDNLAAGYTTDTIVMQMLSSILQLEKLVVYCPFTSAGLASWLTLQGSNIKELDLRLDNLVDHNPSPEKLSKIECIGAAPNVESIKLWGVLMIHSPKWPVFQKLHNLEIVGAKLEDSALSAALKTCPNLTNLSLIACDGLKYVTIELPQLEQCRLDFYGLGNCSVLLVSPKIQSFDVQGCSWVKVGDTQCLKNLKIANNAGRVYMVDFGNLVALETLDIRGVQWCWDALSKMLQLASEVKHLIMKVEFTGDFEALLPFPEIDFVDFFNSHPKLRRFDMHGAMFAALCQRNSLRNVDSKFVIPDLEEAVITVRSPLNAEQKLNTLESLVKYGRRLKKLKIRILEMKSTHSSADDFFHDICRFCCFNRKIASIE